jgi:hypothetical protein
MEWTLQPDSRIAKATHSKKNNLLKRKLLWMSIRLRRIGQYMHKPLLEIAERVGRKGIRCTHSNDNYEMRRIYKKNKNCGEEQKKMSKPLSQRGCTFYWMLSLYQVSWA